MARRETSQSHSWMRPWAFGMMVLCALAAPVTLEAQSPAPPAEAAPAAAAPAGDGALLGESPERYAQVKTLQGSATIRKGDVEDSLTPGVPVGEGDVVDSHGRGILQLGDGTRVAFGEGTRFQVASLFADRDGVRQVLLRLDYGRLRTRLGATSVAQVRLDTPQGSATLLGAADVSLEAGSDGTLRVKVFSGRVSLADAQDKAVLQAGERITLYSAQDRLDRVGDFNTYTRDDFEAWSDPSMAVRRGESWNHVPEEIRYYADDLDATGDWVFVDDVGGWCWRPQGVSVEWRPYWRGRWGCYGGGMTWVSDEPWGYVTYHHGRWGWGARFGWYWVPGVYYSPAWVAWSSNDAYFGWAPLGCTNAPCVWGYGPWAGGPCWNVVDMRYVGYPRIYERVCYDPVIVRAYVQERPLLVIGGRPGWTRGPLFVTRQEMRDPMRFRQVVGQRGVEQARFQAYERQAYQQTGRTVLRGTPGGPAANGRVAFEERRPSSSAAAIMRPSRIVSPPAPSDRTGGRMGPSRPEPPAMGRQPEARTGYPSRPSETRPAEPGYGSRPAESRPEYRSDPRSDARPESRPASRTESGRGEARGASRADSAGSRRTDTRKESSPERRPDR
jgi:hypothetical protein